MEKINVNELKKIQIEILDYINKFCDENNIKYWIDCGTLLGAVRHKGYIPWDDDIDVGMLREDYDKFIEKFEDKNGRYEFLSYERDKNWMFPFGKVIDNNTILYEPDKKHGIASAVYVDVFPYDNAPENEKARNNMFRKRNIYSNLTKLQRYNCFYTEKKAKYNFIRYPFHLLISAFPKDYFVKKSIRLSKQYNKYTTSIVGNFTSYTKQFCSKKVFNSFVKVEFEGKKYPAPIGYDEWLKSFYGDYMKLPPKEKQISHHRYEAYYKWNSRGEK